MDELISRQKMKNMITNHWSDFSNETNYRTALACVDAVPAITPVQPEPKRGEWLECDVFDEHNITEWQSAKCSVCGHYHTTPYLYNFTRYSF